MTRGRADEFDRSSKAKTLLNRSIVFYRTEAGVLTAMQKHCLHRSFPLSEGYLEGDHLVCRYYDIRDTPDGEIARIPRQNQTSNKKLQRYPLKEVGPFVFIWMGDEEGSDYAFSDLPFFSDPNDRTIHDFITFQGNYLLLMENLIDLTRVAYLHKHSFGFDNGFFEFRWEEKNIDGTIWSKRIDSTRESAMAAMPPNIKSMAQAKHVERWDGGRAVTPGIFIGSAPLFTDEEGDPDRKVFNQKILCYVTPETETTSHHWWSMPMDFETNNDMMYVMLMAHLGNGFDECEWAQQYMQELLSADHVAWNRMINPAVCTLENDHVPR